MAPYADRLAEALSDEDEVTRQWAAEALTNLAVLSGTRPGVGELLSHPDREVRRRVAETLGHLPRSASLPALALAAAESPPAARKRALSLLREMGCDTSPESLGSLCEARGIVLLESGDFQLARRYLEAARDYYLEAGDSESAERVSSLLGEAPGG
ncbi:MAG: hypothetical protein DRO06_03670 [Thermoproteota archaeon]|nr:MAG: hypothetical protein DRO06_03670 [Candidatus Korarchaeota archaeon]